MVRKHWGGQEALQGYPLGCLDGPRTWSCQGPLGLRSGPLAGPVEGQPAVPSGSKETKVHAAEVVLVDPYGRWGDHTATRAMPGPHQNELFLVGRLCQAGRDWASARAEASPAFHALTTAVPFSVSATL